MILARYSPEFSLVIFIMGGALMLYRILKYFRYQPVDAVVIEKTDYAKSGARHVVEYRYNGMLYTNATEERTKMVKRDGAEVKCLVNPNDPDKVVFASVLRNSLLFLLVCVAFACYEIIRLSA